MASNPLFQVEDQTDEDFFDRLVKDDEFESTVVDPGFDSDEAKALANLTVDDSGDEGVYESKGEKNLIHDDVGLLGAQVKNSNSLVSSNSFAFDGEIESSNIGQVTASDSVSNSDEPGGNAVKEVGWNSFHTDLAHKGNNGFGSYSDFFSHLEDNSGEFPGEMKEDLTREAKIVSNDEVHKAGGLDNVQTQVDQGQGTFLEQSTDMQDLNSSQYWGNLYPGWRYDANTSQWHQIDGNDTTVNAQGSLETNAASDWADTSIVNPEVSYLQQSTQAVTGVLSDYSSTEKVSNWNEISQVNNGYPEHMVFDPQYPGWYYDTIAQQWSSLESYTSVVQSTIKAHDQQNHNGLTLTDMSAHNSNSNYGEYTHTNNYGSQGLGSQAQAGSWAQSYDNYNQQSLDMWQPENVATSNNVSNLGGSQPFENSYGSQIAGNNHVNYQEHAFGAVQLSDTASKHHSEANGNAQLRSFVSDGTFRQPFNQPSMWQNEQMHFSEDHYGSQKQVNDYYGSQKSENLSHQSIQSGHQFPYADVRSSAGRPPHALVSFGFGGKLIVMKDSSSLMNYGSQDPSGGSISLLNLMEVVMRKTDASTLGGGVHDYFRALCLQSFPGPLVGGSVGSKELNKWIDERITSCDSPNMDSREGKILMLLFSLLKISCQHYGKLRSPFGTDTALRENDTPETAVARLFVYSKRSGSQLSGYGANSHCLQKFPSEGQIRATASEVQNLLVSGSKKEALQCAQEGQLWGPALVLASQLGDQFYVDTVKQMALRQLVAGSPLRTLCLLIAGQPADVFSTDTTSNSNFPGPVYMPQQPAQFGANSMLDDWEENLAVIIANRTKDDELVIIHLGDCLWKERNEIIAAHICYLVAEANFESYSDSARLCLVGADHWKSPRTYASPEAIQRTELYEYSKVLGNSQFILLPYQPYKIIYAHMLAEVGKVSESLKYCQAVLKSLKTGRAPEVETWKQLVVSFEERLRTHQQSGYAANLASAKLVGKFLNFIDSTAHRVVGGLPPPGPTTTQGNEQYHQSMAPRVSTSQSTLTFSSMIPSASMEPISNWTADDNKMTVQNRSVSEPDIGRSKDQVDSSKVATISNAQSKSSGGASRFPRFGFGSQLLQKTVELVLRQRPDKQAKLGDSNKFYYDEKLKRWVEEGAEPPAEEAALPPPPTTVAFQNGRSDYNLNSAMKSDGSLTNTSPSFKSPTSSEHASGIPPIPPSSNQFSARARMGVRSRYVDTFNQGGGSPANLFQSPSVPSVKPAVAANAKFFIPTPVSTSEQTMEAMGESIQEDTATSEPSTSNLKESSFQSSSPSPSMTMPRFSSMDNISSKGSMANVLLSQSRRTASWSGSLSDAYNPKSTAIKPLGETLGMSGSFMPRDPSSMRMPMSRGSFGDDLHEVDL